MLFYIFYLFENFFFFNDNSCQNWSIALISVSGFIHFLTGTYGTESTFHYCHSHCDHSLHEVYWLVNDLSQFITDSWEGALIWFPILFYNFYITYPFFLRTLSICIMSIYQSIKYIFIYSLSSHNGIIIIIICTFFSLLYSWSSRKISVWSWVRLWLKYTIFFKHENWCFNTK